MVPKQKLYYRVLKFGTKFLILVPFGTSYFNFIFLNLVPNDIETEIHYRVLKFGTEFLISVPLGIFC